MGKDLLLIFSIGKANSNETRYHVVPVVTNEEDYEFFNEEFTDFTIPMFDHDFMKSLLEIKENSSVDNIEQSVIFAAPLNREQYKKYTADNKMNQLLGYASNIVFAQLDSRYDSQLMLSYEYCIVAVSGVKGEEVECIPKQGIYTADYLIRSMHEIMNIPNTPILTSTKVGIGEAPYIIPMEALAGDTKRMEENNIKPETLIETPMSAEDAIKGAQEAVKYDVPVKESNDRVIHYCMPIIITLDFLGGFTLEILRRFEKFSNYVLSNPLPDYVKDRISDIIPRSCFILDNPIIIDNLDAYLSAFDNMVGITPDTTYTEFERDIKSNL